MTLEFFFTFEIFIFIKMLRKLIPKTDFSKNIFTLMTGNTIAQIIQIAIIPVLTRLYTPADFGVFAVYLSIASIISTVAAMRYELAVMLPKDEKEAVNLLILAVILAIVVSLLSFFSLLAVKPIISYFIKNQNIIKWLFFVPISILFSSMYQIFNVWSNRKTRYKIMTTSIISQRGSSAATNVIMGFAKLGQAGLVFGNIIGQLTSVVILFLKILRNDIEKVKLIDFKVIKEVSVKYKKFPLFDSVNTIFFNFSTKGIIVLITKFFGDVIVGFYSLTERIMITPFSFFTTAFSQAFYQKLSFCYNHNKGNFNNIIIQAIQKMAAIITIPFLILVGTSKWFIPVIFGEEWAILYKYVIILSPFVYISFISSPYSDTLKIINKQNVALIMNMITFIVKFLSIIITAYFFHTDILVTMIFFSFISLLSTIFAIVIINYYLKIKFSKYYTIVLIVAVIFYTIVFILIK